MTVLLIQKLSVYVPANKLHIKLLITRLGLFKKSIFWKNGNLGAKRGVINT